MNILNFSIVIVFVRGISAIRALLGNRRGNTGPAQLCSPLQAPCGVSLCVGSAQLLCCCWEVFWNLNQSLTHVLGTETAPKLGLRRTFLLGQTGKAVPDSLECWWPQLTVCVSVCECGIQGIHCALALVCLLWQLYITDRKLKLNMKKPKPVCRVGGNRRDECFDVSGCKCRGMSQLIQLSVLLLHVSKWRVLQNSVRWIMKGENHFFNCTSQKMSGLRISKEQEEASCGTSWS